MDSERTTSRGPDRRTGAEQQEAGRSRARQQQGRGGGGQRGGGGRSNAGTATTNSGDTTAEQAHKQHKSRGTSEGDKDERTGWTNGTDNEPSNNNQQQQKDTRQQQNTRMRPNPAPHQVRSQEALGRHTECPNDEQAHEHKNQQQKKRGRATREGTLLHAEFTDPSCVWRAADDTSTGGRSKQNTKARHAPAQISVNGKSAHSSICGGSTWQHASTRRIRERLTT